MKIYKSVSLFWLIAKNATIKSPEIIKTFLLAILDLAQIQPLTIDFINEKLGFSNQITQTLLNRLLKLGLIDQNINDNTYILTDPGRQASDDKEIFIIHEVNLRLLVTVSPHFVLSNHWYIPKRIDENQDRFPKEFITERQRFSNLHQQIYSIPEDPIIVAKNSTKIALDLSENFPQVLYHYDTTNREHHLPIKPDDPDIRDIYVRLWDKLQPTMLNETINVLITDSLSSLTFITAHIENVQQQYKLDIDLANNILTNEQYSTWIKWLVEKNWNNDLINLSLIVEDGWYFDVDILIQTHSEELLYGMFCIRVINDEILIKELIQEKYFNERIKNLWNSFILQFGISFQIDSQKLFDRLWLFNSAKCKVIASRIVEEKILYES